MISVDEREIIRRAYFLEDRSIREIARELHHDDAKSLPLALTISPFDVS